MGCINQALTPPEVIELANSLIKGTQHQENLRQWKKKHIRHNDGEDTGRVGQGFFNNFMKRWGHKLVTKSGKTFASDRNDWQKLCFFEQMYDNVYTELVESGLAEKVEPVYRDIDNNVVEEESEIKLGRKCDINITHPSYFLTFDETGCNTNMLKDGKVGGQKYVVARGAVPKSVAATSEHKFTLLPIVAVSGEPVICVIIFAGGGENVRADLETGIDITVTPVLDEKGEILMTEENVGGNGKYFPSGPVCEFMGKRIRTRCYVNPKGGITSEILVDVLRHLDGLQVFDRNGRNPVLLVDGHETRLTPSFIKYINSPEHKWSVNLGVPYCTNIWQAGDSSEQNGTFKSEWYRVKKTDSRKDQGWLTM